MSNFNLIILAVNSIAIVCLLKLYWLIKKDIIVLTKQVIFVGGELSCMKASWISIEDKVNEKNNIQCGNK